MYTYDIPMPAERLPAALGLGYYGGVTTYAGTYALAGTHIVLKTNHGRFAVVSVDGAPRLVAAPRLHSAWELAGAAQNRDPRFAGFGCGYENGFGFSHLFFSRTRMVVRSFEALYGIGRR
jgi:hypothetical protein